MIKRNQLLRRSPTIASSTIQGKTLPWVLVKRTLHNTMNSIFAGLNQEQYPDLRCSARRVGSTRHHWGRLQWPPIYNHNSPSPFLALIVPIELIINLHSIFFKICLPPTNLNISSTRAEIFVYFIHQYSLNLKE